MEASRVQNGIQLLLATEQEAQQIVNTARNTKMARLKRAKEKTEKEVALQFQVEADFERKVAGVYEFKFSMYENGLLPPIFKSQF
ncbi:hypothetical protein AB3S75_034419 [Citrus x aurantiifolia]